MPETDRTEKSNEKTVESKNSCSLDDSESASESLSDRWTKQVWAAGSYGKIAPKYARMAGHLVDQAAVGSGDEVLDIGCGTGSVAIAAARSDARVTGLDIQPALIEQGKENAETAGVTVEWREGNAVSLPFEADMFDVTLSNLGHMYGDPPSDAAHEIIRVTRPGGRIGFTSWTPNSLYPAMAGVVMTVVSPGELPDFSQPPFLWGDSNTVRQRLGGSVTEIEFETASVKYQALSPAHFWEQTAADSGMFVEILDVVDEKDIPNLREQLVETIEPYYDDRNNAVELEYLLTTATVSPQT